MPYRTALMRKALEKAAELCPRRTDGFSSEEYTGVYTSDLRALADALSDLDDFESSLQTGRRTDWAPVFRLLPEEMSIWMHPTDFAFLRQSGTEMFPETDGEKLKEGLVARLRGRMTGLHVSRRIPEGAVYLEKERRLPETFSLGNFRVCPWTTVNERNWPTFAG